MVLLTTTASILAAINSLSHPERTSLNALPTSEGAPIEHKTLITLSRLCKDYPLNSLLRGSSIYIPPPPPKPAPSEEYVELMQRLRHEEQQRQYAAMVSKRESLDEPGEKDDISPSLVLNIFLSVVLSAAAIFYVTRIWKNDGLRVLVSLFTGVLVGAAEVTVYAAYLRKVKQSRDKERAKKETKEFIGEFKPSDTGSKLDSTSIDTWTEKEEIWGRGVNGGRRRRVREKWERAQET